MKKIISLLILCSAIAYGTKETPKIRITLHYPSFSKQKLDGSMASEKEKVVKLKFVATQLNKRAVGSRGPLGSVLTSQAIKRVSKFDLLPTEENIGLLIDDINVFDTRFFDRLHVFMQSQDHYPTIRRILEEKCGKNKAINIEFNE